MHSTGRTFRTLTGALLLSVAIALSAHAGGKFDNIKIPGATATIVTDALAVTEGSDRYFVAGYYIDGEGSAHAFLGTPDDGLETFDPPDSVETVPGCLVAGLAVGGYYKTSEGKYRGFIYNTIRKKFKTFDVDGSDTLALDCNDKEAIVGAFRNGAFDAPYSRTKQGEVTKFDVPGATKGARAEAINDKGAIAGNYFDDAGSHGFQRDRDGTVTPVSCPDFTLSFAWDINNKGTIAGGCGDTIISTHGFVKAPGEDAIVFDVPSAKNTQAYGINAAGDATGSYNLPDGSGHGFIRKKNGHIVTFDVPKANGTFPQSIDDTGFIGGIFFDNKGEHGFVRKP